MTVSLALIAASKETHVDAAAAAVLSELDGVFSLNERQRMAQKDFLSGYDVFALLPSGFGSGLGHHSTQLATEQCCGSSVAPFREP